MARPRPDGCPRSSRRRSRRLLDRAEDPAETLDYGYQKQVELLQNVKKGIADVVTSKKRLQMQSQKLEQQVVKLDTQARQALVAGPRGPRPRRARAQDGRADRAAVARRAGQGAREPAGAADREREEAAHEDRDLPHQEGGHQGPVLRRRGAGQDLRGRQRGRRGDGRPRARDPARRGQDRADARPRVGASRSSRRPATFDDLTAARRRPGRHRPRAGAARRRRPGRRRAGEDEGRARLGRRRRPAARAGRGGAGQ